MQAVVEHLIFEAECRVVGRIGHRDLFGDVVLDAAVPRATDLPVPGELEIAECVDRHEIAAGCGLPVGQTRNVAIGEFSDCSVLYFPVRGRHAVIAETTPAVERLPVEEQAPSGRLLLSRQCVWGGDEPAPRYHRMRGSIEAGRSDAARARQVGALAGRARAEQNRAAKNHSMRRHHAWWVPSRTGSSRGASKCIINHALTYARPQTTNIGA